MIDPVTAASSRVGWLVVAMAAFSLGAVIDNPMSSVIVTSTGLLALVFSLKKSRFPDFDFHILGGLLAVVVVLVGNTQVMGRFSLVPGSYRLWFALALVTGGLTVLSARMPLRKLTVLLALATTIVGSLSVLIPNWEPVASSDVYRAHVAAGNALIDTKNPYSDAVVFESGDPNKPDRTLVEGYPYPPPVLFTYGLLGAFTDPRLVSLASWLAIVLGLAVVAAGKRSVAPVALAVLALTATMPIWRVALFMSWTEPLSMALIAGALVGILRNRRWGWFLLGIAVASKQYLVLLAPVILMHRDVEGRRPGWVSVATSAVVAGFPALFGLSEYYGSVIGVAAAVGFRPDTQSLNGAIASLGGEIVLPMIVVIPVLVGLLYALTRMDLPPASLPAAGVATLGVALLVTSAFPNYWMLVAILAGFSALFGMSCDDYRRSESPASPSGDVEISIRRDQVAENAVPRDS